MRSLPPACLGLPPCFRLRTSQGRSRTPSHRGRLVLGSPPAPAHPCRLPLLGHPGSSLVRHQGPHLWGTLVPPPWGAPSLPRGAPRTPPWVFAAVTPEAAGSVEPGPCSRRWPCLRSDELTWAEPRSVGGRRGLRSRTGVATQPAPWWGRDSHSEPHAHTRELRLPGFTLC